MHGIIFLALEDFLEARLGAQAWPQALLMTRMEDQQFDPDRYYPDETAEQLFQAAAQLLKTPLQKTLELFGKHMASGLVAMSRSMGIIQKDWKTLDILEHLQSHILAPFSNVESGVIPPDIRTYRLKHGEVAVAYISKRKYCYLMKGIVRGLGELFQEPIALKEYVCMLQEAPLCRLSVYLDDPYFQRYVDIEREFGQIQSRIEELTIYNTYAGAPFSAPGLVMRYSKDEVLIQAPVTQLITMMEEKLSYLSLPHLSQGVKAMVREVDIKQGFVSLNTIRLTDGTVGGRHTVRVLPEKPIAMRMKLGKRNLRGTLLNISSGGARMLLDKDSQLPEVLLFEPVVTEFALPLKYIELGDTIELGPPQLTLDGNILDVSPLSGTMAVRIVFASMVKRDRMILEQYCRTIEEAANTSLQNRMAGLLGK
ncbi:MAG: heme NO-binding domain-containing protein [Magnetococcales bacterium]|nr:heme NO-binding domain-containing protein [Magnetococcales bacterium]